MIYCLYQNFPNLYLPIMMTCDPRAGHSGTFSYLIMVQTGAAPALSISRKKGSFLRPPHARNIVKEGYFFVPMYDLE